MLPDPIDHLVVVKRESCLIIPFHAQELLTLEVACNTQVCEKYLAL